MESENLSFRIKSGLQERKRKKLPIGRQPGSIESTEQFLQKHKKVVSALNRGESVRVIAGRLGLANSTVMKVRKVLTFGGKRNLDILKL